MPVTNLSKGERVTLLILLTKDSGVFRNFNFAGGGVAPADRAKAEIVRLRNGQPADNVGNLDQLFNGAGQIDTPANVAAALGLAADFYDPSGPCPPAGNGDVAIYQKLINL